jgi:hypothetical protein
MLEVAKINTAVSGAVEGQAALAKTQKEQWDLLQEHLHKAVDMDVKYDQHLKALDLEVKRLKERQVGHVHSGPPPVPQEITLKQTRPFVIRVLKSEIPKGAKVASAKKAKSKQ